MITYERQQKILNYLGEKHFSTVKELSEHIYASESSIRRDIKALEQKGLLRQIYGGVVLPEYENAVVPINLRDHSNSQVKDTLAKIAASRLQGGETILMDGSSTVRRLVKYIDGLRDLKIVTNNVAVLKECHNPSAKIYATGGLFIPHSNIFVGNAAERYISSINADVVFFSSQALSDDGEISDASEEETALRQVMLSRAKRKIFLCDSSKLGQKRTFSLCSIDDIDEVICDKPLP